MILSLDEHPSRHHLQAEITPPSGWGSFYGYLTCSLNVHSNICNNVEAVLFWVAAHDWWKVQRTDLFTLTELWLCLKKHNTPYVSIDRIPVFHGNTRDAALEVQWFISFTNSPVWLISWLTAKRSLRKVTCFGVILSHRYLRENKTWKPEEAEHATNNSNILNKCKSAAAANGQRVANEKLGKWCFVPTRFPLFATHHIAPMAPNVSS